MVTLLRGSRQTYAEEAGHIDANTPCQPQAGTCDDMPGYIY